MAAVNIGSFGMVAAVAALAWVVGRRERGRAHLPAAVSLAAVVSLVVTLSFVSAGPRRGEDLWGLVESLTLIALLGLMARWSPVRQAVPAGVLGGVAASTWLLRYVMPASPLEGIGMCAFWALGVLAAVGVGGYLRSLDTRRVRAVRDERAAQRLRLARDLHDFVAHDVSEMVAQAQAGQVVGVGDSVGSRAQALAALQRIEQAGLRAMATLDRTVLELHAGPGLEGLAELAARFSSAGPARVELSVDERLDVPEETAALAYRIVVEALTNVRRHAPEATLVEVAVRDEGGMLEVSVDDDGGGGTRESGRGGFGLPSLTAQAESMGGRLRASPAEGGWTLVARLPLAP